MNVCALLWQPTGDLCVEITRFLLLAHVKDPSNMMGGIVIERLCQTFATNEYDMIWPGLLTLFIENHLLPILILVNLDSAFQTVCIYSKSGVQYRFDYIVD